MFLPLAFFFAISAVFLLVVPFLSPPGGIGDTPPIPYYVYPLVGISIFAFGALYWAVWWVLMPKLGKYRLNPTKKVLKDGTVTTYFEKIKNE